MRKNFVVFIVLLLCLAAPSFAKERFVSFPGLGECNGTYVRYREDPNTEAEIIGRLNTHDRVIVLSQTAVEGEIWYEIEDPKSDRIAFVYGKYIEPVFMEQVQRGKSYSLMVEILQNYGITKEKAEEYYEGPRVKTRYTDGTLTYVEASRNGCSFGEISIGDDREKVEEVLGRPDDNKNDILEYEIDLDTFLSFYIEDGKVVKMTFDY